VEIKNEGYRVGRAMGFTFSRLAARAHDGELILDPENTLGNKFIMTLPVATD